MTRLDPELAPLAPFRQPVFRMLWSTWLMANLSMWMNDVAAAWMMASLTTTPIWVALVQTAATLPVFLLGLPSGALADTFDRKRHLLYTQLWIAGVALLLSAVVFWGGVTPPLLLALVFANGIGLAMRWPVFAAIMPELVPRAQLPAALALNGVSMNASRIVGPLLAGALIAEAGTAWVFALNAGLSLSAAWVVTHWERTHTPHPLGPERLSTAIRVGLQYIVHSRPIQASLLRIWIFFFHSTAVMSMLPLVAKRMDGGNARTFTLLLASMGAGAIAATGVLPRLRQRYARDTLVVGGAVLQALATATMAETHQLWVAVPTMFLAGTAWITTANALSVAMQLRLPDWVRARGMATYQMAIMGGSACGAAWWGQIATWHGIPVSLGVAAFSGAVCMGWAHRYWPDDATPLDLSTQPGLRPKPPMFPPHGAVCTQVEYRIDPTQTTAFLALLQGAGRSSHLRQGAQAWALWQDMHQPGRWIEQITDRSWVDHLRRLERHTATDWALEAQKQAFQLPDIPVQTTYHSESGKNTPP